MYRLTVNDQSLELNTSLFYHYIWNTIVSLYDMTEMLFSMQIMGYPDSVRKTTIPYITKDILVLEESVTQIEDEDLCDNLRELLQRYRSLIDIDNDMANLISTLSGLTLDELKASGKYGKFQREPHSSDATYPEWYDNMIFQQLLKRVKKHMVSILEKIEKTIVSLRRYQEINNSGDDAEITIRTLEKITALRKVLHNTHNN